MNEEFKFKTELRVRNYEVDWQGIVHNANYLLYFEVGRIEYLRHLGIPVTMDTIMGEAKIVVARNEINYRSPARFNDTLDIYTRISSIKNTSFVFEGIMKEASSRRLLADNISVHVWLEANSETPTRVPDAFREIIREYEGR
ncbi:MAG: acyl-CoA thioesterase [Bacteroidetes bacterium]|nr:MAG: acyl-CoA thioesterase [Bacteroidota bacterium]